MATPVHTGKAIGITPAFAVGFDPDGRPVVVPGTPGAERPPIDAILAAVLQVQQAMATDLAILTLWLRQLEADNASPIVKPPPGLRLV